MIITKEQQQRVIDNWNTEEKSTRDLLCFLEGMEAMIALWIKIEKDKTLDTLKSYNSFFMSKS